jgi:hypothetical protein
MHVSYFFRVILWASYRLFSWAAGLIPLTGLGGWGGHSASGIRAVAAPAAAAGWRSRRALCCGPVAC